MKISLSASVPNENIDNNSRVICKLDTNEWLTGTVIKLAIKRIVVNLDDGTEVSFTGKDLAHVHRMWGTKKIKTGISDKAAQKYIVQIKPEVKVQPAIKNITPAGIDQTDIRHKDLKPTEHDKQHLPKGWYISRWYDSSTRNWVATLHDEKGNQMYSSMFVYSKPDVLDINYDSWKYELDLDAKIALMLKASKKEPVK